MIQSVPGPSLRALRIWAALVILVGLGTTWVGATATRWMTPGPLFQGTISVLVFAVIWLCAALVAVAAAKPRPRQALLLGAVLLASILPVYQSGRLGILLRDRDFETLRPAMLRAVRELELLPDSMLTQADPARVLPEASGRVYRIEAQRLRSGDLQVAFLYGGLFLPPRSSAWLYTTNADGTQEQLRERGWRAVRPLRAHWFDGSRHF